MPQLRFCLRFEVSTPDLGAHLRVYVEAWSRDGPGTEEAKMKISSWNKKKLERTIIKMFGKGTRRFHRGDFVFVHLESEPADDESERDSRFEPTDFFDPECPHCRPFLEDGAIMVYTDEDLVGIRLLESGMFETVMLKRNVDQRANMQ